MWLFKWRKKEQTLVESSQYGGDKMIQSICQSTTKAICESDFQSTESSGDKMARLMQLISKAIDDWAKEYQLENMPKKIIFEQVLDAMHAIEINWDSKSR